MIRCTKQGCKKAVTRRARPALTPHEQGWRWTWSFGWRCPSHIPGEVHAPPEQE